MHDLRLEHSDLFQSHLYVALDQEYIDRDAFDSLYNQADEVNSYALRAKLDSRLWPLDFLDFGPWTLDVGLSTPDVGPWTSSTLNDSATQLCTNRGHNERSQGHDSRPDPRDLLDFGPWSLEGAGVCSEGSKLVSLLVGKVLWQL
jgi:hypothetical protein